MSRKNPIVLTRRGEKVMLIVSWLSVFLLIVFANDLANLLN